MIAYHWLQADMTAGRGDEPAWTEGEERTVKTRRKKLVLCVIGYHSSPTLFDALEYGPGPVACIVEVSEPEGRDETKFVSRTRKLIKAVNVEKELGFFACDCAERALNREREHGREPDPRSWAAIETARAYWRGETTAENLAAASTAASAAAWDAASAAASAAESAAARDAESAWQRQRFNETVLVALGIVECPLCGQSTTDGFPHENCVQRENALADQP